MKGHAGLLSFILWISSNFLCILGQTKDPPDYLYPSPDEYPLWCIFCRSDKDNACINKVIANQDKFTKPCTNETLKEFNKDLQLTKPDRPIIEPRIAGEELHWGCYRVYTLDQTFTFRTCQKTLYSGTEEECNPCHFDQVKAMCCTCLTPNCNFKNSDARRILFEHRIILFSIVILSISLIFTGRCN